MGKLNVLIKSGSISALHPSSDDKINIYVKERGPCNRLEPLPPIFKPCT